MRKSRPGPVGTSCLTCKRRRKKCDQRQPTCESCEAGNFECMGYGHISSVVARAPRPIRPLLPKPAESANQLSSKSLHNEGISSDPSCRDRVPTNTASILSHEIPNSLDVGIRSGFQTNESHQTDTSDSVFSHGLSTDRLHPWPFKSANAPMSTSRDMIGWCTQLPRSLPGTFQLLDDQWFVQLIVAQRERVTNYWYFKPSRAHDYKEQLQLKVSGRLNNTKFTRWIFLVVMSVIESLLTGDMSHIQLYRNWIDYIEGSLRAELALELPPCEMQRRWCEWVHVSVIRTMLLSDLNAYQALRKIAPAFLQVMYSSPTLWSLGSDLTRVPLSSALSSASHELACFTLIDCTYAMVSGLPQQIEYDTKIYSQLPPLSRYQLTHGFPTELLLILADINACRDKSPYAHDWRDIEHQLLKWQSCHTEHMFTESWMTIAWYAVQESWRLALLIYLYLAVCNVSSEDSRVQSRAKQILQVAGTVKKRGPSNASVSFCNQYLMVSTMTGSDERY
ncbi:hypothetical protein RSOLAG1IB_06479 [Rhizoctonia solani AG-1 IB]|uniref:Zn(2)-C6 fungal-type domain-containing protein n=1 Tax=Thanatephorus cucumeris (strain AG1-IB / isolate 7/3/14) TaxID=1108050 RepID=A0A0B7F9R4_THACB|nr:hypothetical protein RSOLAG1IB_06479 [Rhizoctonia solani AG-1 IB]